MGKKPEPPNPTSWDIYRVANKGKLLGTIEAADTDAAIEAAAKEFKIDAWRLCGGDHVDLSGRDRWSRLQVPGH
jgi:hypothetical protein